MSVFFEILDLVGTFAFAISGATLGVRKQLDLFGVLVLSFAAATAGGMVRDVVIGAGPPLALVHWPYIAIPMLAGIVTFYGYSWVDRMNNPVQLTDAAGLALYSVTGAAKALAYGMPPSGAILIGLLSGIGGGVLRDMLVTEIPSVLYRELYAVAALAGATCVVVGAVFDLPRPPVYAVGAALCFFLRFMAIRKGWKLPVAVIRRPES